MDIGKILLIVGIVFVIVGLLSQVFPLFKLPGDINVSKNNFSFHFPIVTSIIISIVLTIIINLFLRR